MRVRCPYCWTQYNDLTDEHHCPNVTTGTTEPFPAVDIRPLPSLLKPATMPPSVEIESLRAELAVKDARIAELTAEVERLKKSHMEFHGSLCAVFEDLPEAWSASTTLNAAKAVRRSLAASREEAAKLREALTAALDADHADSCNSWEFFSDLPCNCWKATTREVLKVGGIE